MRLVVVDASALVEYLLRTERGDEIRARVENPDADLHAPALCDVEVGAGLRRALLEGSMDETRSAEALRDYLDLPVARHAHTALLERVLSLRTNFSAYDATYVALAERLGADLLTADRPLRRAVTNHTFVGMA